MIEVFEGDEAAPRFLVALPTEDVAGDDALVDRVEAFLRASLLASRDRSGAPRVRVGGRRSSESARMDLARRLESTGVPPDGSRRA